MPKVIYRYSGSSSELSDLDFGDLVKSEINGGDIVIRAGAVVEFCLERALDGPITCTRFTALNVLESNWRRTADRIRLDGGKFFLFRFLKRGTVRTVTSSETALLTAGRFSITRGDVPYVSQSMPDQEGIHESLQVWVPSHRIAYLLPEESFTGSFSFDTAVGAVAASLLNALFLYGEQVTAEIRDRLADALIAALLECVGIEREVQRSRVGIAETRLNAIINLVHESAMQPHLDAETVAKRCGISRRYMSRLLSRKNLQFVNILRDARLRRAETILASEDGANRTVGEIAQLSGFQSASYFSRLFKARHGRSPRSFRAECQGGSVRTGEKKLKSMAPG